MEQEVVVNHESGIHARPAALIVKLASQFEAEVFLTCEGTEVNSKSIMSVMMLAAAQNSAVLIKAEGSDAAQAVAAMVKLFESDFQDHAERET